MSVRDSMRMRRWLAGSYRRCGKLPPELPLRPAPHVVLMLLVALPMLVSVATALPSWLRDEQLTSGLADVTDIVFFSDGRALVASLTGVVTLVVPQPGQVHGESKRRDGLETDESRHGRKEKEGVTAGLLEQLQCPLSSLARW